MFNGVFDCWEGADNALVVGDFGIGLFVEGDVEVDLSEGRQLVFAAIGTESHSFSVFTYPDEDAFVLQITVRDRKLVGKRHGGLRFSDWLDTKVW